MGFRGVGGEHRNIGHACDFLPVGDKFVHDSMERLSAHRGHPSLVSAAAAFDSEGDAGGTHDADRGGKVIGEVVENDRIGAQRQVRSPDFERSGGDDEFARVSQDPADGDGSHFLESQRTGHLNRRTQWGWFGQIAIIVAAVEWLGAPSILWLAVLVGGTLVSFLGGSSSRSSGLVIRVSSIALLAIATLMSPVGRRLADPSPSKMARSRRAAEVELERALDAMRLRLEALSLRVATLSLQSPEDAFGTLHSFVPEVDPSVALAILDQAGRTDVWAGDHRLMPSASSAPIVFSTNAYYEVLEVRRQRQAGGYAVSSTVLGADSTVPFPGRSLEHILRDRFGFGVEFSRPEAAASGGIAWPRGDPVLVARPILPDPDIVSVEWTRRVRRLSGVLVLLITFLVVFTAPRARVRYGFLLLALWVVVRAPLNDILGWQAAFDPTSFFSPLLGPFSRTAGALALSGSVLFAAAVWLWHHQGRWRTLLVPLCLLITLGTPLMLREFGRGITPPSEGIGLGLWWTWHLALLLPTAGILTAVAAMIKRNRRLEPRVVPAVLGGLLAVLVAALGLTIFDGGPSWPAWYLLLWVPPVWLAVWPARRAVSITVLAFVSGAGASLMTWGAALAGRTDVAVRDLDGLGPIVDPLVEPLLMEFGSGLMLGGVADNPTQLFGRWQASAASRQRYPARLTLWTEDSVENAAGVGAEQAHLIGAVKLDALRVPDSVVLRIASASLDRREPTVTQIAAFPGVHYLLTVPMESRRFITVLVGPRSVLVESAPLGRVLGTGFDLTSLYRLSLAPVPVGRFAVPEGQWRREGWTLRMWRSVPYADGLRETHALIPLGTPPWLFVRGALLIFLDVALIGLLWLLAERIVGIPRHATNWRRVTRSFRTRLAVALAAWCIIPASLLAGLSTIQLRSEAGRSRELVLQRVLRDALPTEGFLEETSALHLREQAERVDADLGLYHQGVLTGTSEPILRDLGVFSPLLDASAYHAIHLDGDQTAFPSGGRMRQWVRASYATVPAPRASIPAVLATLAPGNDRVLRERQLDVAALLLLATVLGILAAIVGARRASLALSRPVTDLRRAALAFGAGHDPGVSGARQPPEFEPVFDAFGRMARDVSAAQTALETARQRTDAVLGTVTTGVVAVAPDGQILLANRQAEEALGRLMVPGEPFAASLSPDWGVLSEEVSRRLKQEGIDEGEVEVLTGERQFMVQFAPLGSAMGGLVLAVNDITESTRAARVLAWGEVASQVAHAIKNPLTPVRLGIQHLQRVRGSQPSQLPSALDETVGRLLAEIDRLDGIARAFSRFAAPGTPNPTLELVRLAEVVGEAGALYQLVPEIDVGIELPANARAACRGDELKEVLLNLFDNARNAGATHITVRGSGAYIEVVDDGAGIPPELLPRVFEPRFSSTSSGAGLGLAIVRRLVEGWGGTVSITSEVGSGTTVHLKLAEGNPL